MVCLKEKKKENYKKHGVKENFSNGKFVWMQVAQDLQRSDSTLYRLDAIDFGRRMAVEREIEKTEDVPEPNAIFDESGNFLIYTTLLGIKVKAL